MPSTSLTHKPPPHAIYHEAARNHSALTSPSPSPSLVPPPVTLISHHLASSRIIISHQVHAGITDEASGVVLTRGVWGFREASPYSHELDVDPMGFAFGGIYPGQLHAHGQFIEEHKASYSVGLAGTYKLHVRWRTRRTSSRPSCSSI